MMNKVWLKIFRMEILFAGIFLCGKALVSVNIGIDYSVNFKMIRITPLLLTAGICLLLVGIVFLSIPKVNNYLKTNKIFTYIIPMHIWIFLVLIGMELVLRVTVYNQPFGIVKTNWFGWVSPKSSFYVWGKEGFAITYYDGPPGEISTPFQGGDNIILLGDSFTEGLQVSNDNKFASVAEIVLREDGFNIDLHNLGRSGKALADYVYEIPGFQLFYHPIAIVIQLSESDFLESFNMSKANYFIRENSKIIDVFNKNKFNDNFIVSDVISNNFRLMLWEQYGKSRYDQMMKKPSPETDVSSAPEAFNISLAKQQMDLLIKASNGTPLIFVLIPHAPYISGDQIKMDDSKHENLKGFLSSYPQFILVDPLPEFQNLTSSGILPMGFINSPTPGWGHLNQMGNEVLGKLLAKRIEESLQ
jgi:hypothetical protein